MKIEILEVKLSSDGFQGELGDRFTVPDDIGTNWCSYGWARDLSGQVPTGQRTIFGATISPHNIHQNSGVITNG